MRGTQRLTCRYADGVPFDQDAERSRSLPLWRMPQPMGSLLEFWDRVAPLRVHNSLTRTKVRSCCRCCRRRRFTG